MQIANTEPTQPLEVKIQSPAQDESSSNNSPVKVDKQTIKQKKKKTQALKNFLKQKTSQEIVAPIRKKSGSQTQDVLIEGAELCRVCSKEVMKKRNCGFCNLIACNDHMRKKRKHPKSGKFVRLCGDCEDKHLFEKYMKHQIKVEEALQLQEMIIATKHQQLMEVLNGKKTKMTLLLNKGASIQDEKAGNDNEYNQKQNTIRNNQRRLQSKLIDLDKLEIEIQFLYKNAPRSLEDDYQALTLENQKVTKQLVKYEKMCQEALKAKSKKQKQMYEQYYKWQQRQSQKTKKNGKKQDCIIY